MTRTLGLASILATSLLLVPGVASAQPTPEEDDGHTEPLIVAEPESEPEPEPEPAVKVVTKPCPTCPPQKACPPPPAEIDKTREGVDFTGGLYVLTGIAMEDFHDAGFYVRPSLDFGVSFGLGPVSLFTTASTLAIDAARFSDRTTTGFPFLVTMGLRADSWTLAAAGGISAAVDNDYGDRLDNEESLISPRGEIRAGYRFEEFIEILGHVGVERRRYDNRDDQTRLIVGVSVGFAGP